jgi:hypothetical protein
MLGIDVVEDAGRSSPEHVVDMMANALRRRIDNAEENRRVPRGRAFTTLANLTHGH